ncbi:WW domain-binding protein 11-like [Synchiropus splendidus]|uniref:WW domain-binding protein 11-like n=1 Tax=Synchiropus splendidus TaxID=270530 RepID=UPI00237E5C7F|nr:WW domain-binding protein 11-like [Synchiropus splendidus]
MGGTEPTGEEQGATGKKVVRVVRRVVRRVIPTGTEVQNLPVTTEGFRAAAGAESAPRTSKPVREDGDDISMGLTSLMGRGRTKDHRPRTRNQDRKEDMTEDGKQQQEEEEEEKEKEAGKEEKGAEEQQEQSTPSIPAQPKPNPFTPPPGFIPAPKLDPLAPPAGFIPAPKQNPLSPPPGFIPRKATPALTKQNTLPRPVGFIPVPKVDPLAPPAGFIPKPRTVAVKRPEVLSRAVHDWCHNSEWSMMSEYHQECQSKGWGSDDASQL